MTSTSRWTTTASRCSTCRNAELQPIPSVWGHRAGNPRDQPEDRAFIESHVKALLAQ